MSEARPESNQSAERETQACNGEPCIEPEGRGRSHPRQKPWPGVVTNRITEQAKRTPDATAIILAEESLTYANLDQESNQLAQHLEHLGVGPGTMVGLCAERSLKMVVALIAVAKTGATLVVIDPDLPRERIEFISYDANLTCVLSQTSLLHIIPITKARILNLDEPRTSLFRNNSDRLPRNESKLEDIAHNIYTSGSTGRPKGVLISHAAHLNCCDLAITFWQLKPSDRVLQFARLSFDVGIDQLITPLLAGSTVVMRGSIIWDPAHLTHFIKEHDISIIHLPSAYWKQWVDSFTDADIGNPIGKLRLVQVGGDVMSVAAVRRWRELKFPAIRLINRYGPTESVMFSVAYEVPSESSSDSDRIPVGRPLGPRSIHILDDQLRPLPRGVVGEIHIGGEPLARGYLNRPELTAERFIPDPFNDKPGARLYKTGDMGQILPCGNVDFIGRSDNQVKIHGFRVELGEIESVLGLHPHILSSAVIAKTHEDSDRTLVAFYTARNQGRLSSESLRMWLGKTLPEHMIPARFIDLPDLPINSNGKLDRRKLEQMDFTSFSPDTRSFPLDDEQAGMLEIWRDVLNEKKIGTTDNFFELGGHSLPAIVICSRFNQRFNTDIPLRWIFDYPTISQLIDRARSRSTERENAELPCDNQACPSKSTEPQHPLSTGNQTDRSHPQNGLIHESFEKQEERAPDAIAQSVGNSKLSHRQLDDFESKRTGPVSFEQQAMWLLNQLEPHSAAYNQTHVWKIDGEISKEHLRDSLQKIQARHEVLRTALVLRDGELVQSICPTMEVPWQETTLPRTHAEDYDAILNDYILPESRRAFNLAQAPLWRVLLLEVSSRANYLVVTFHHSIIDEWSIRLFLSELAHFYTCGEQQDSTALETPAKQYSDYAVWQRERLTNQRLEALQEYWRGQLLDLPLGLELPKDPPQNVESSDQGAVHNFQITGPSVAKLRELARQEDTTLFTVMMAAFQVWLFRYTGEGDIVVGTPITRRERPEFQEMIGFFLNTLPIRSHVDGTCGFREILRQVRATLLDAFNHAELPFEKIVELAIKDRDASQQPVCQVMFVLLEQGLDMMRLGSARAESVSLDTGASKYDMTLNVLATEQSFDCTFEYDNDLFTAESVARMSEHLGELLESIAEAPQRPVSQLRLMSKAERHQVLANWNRVEEKYPCDKCVHHLFEAQVTRTPDAVAVVFEGRSLTYQTLNARANQVAHYLLGLGVECETPVGLFMERSLELVVGLLGIIKAGGTYVPIDPCYPADRVGFIIMDADIPVLLTEMSLQRQVPEGAAQVIGIDDPALGLETQSTVNPVSQATATSTIYIIYTSGSTGVPKGCCLTHHNVARLFAATESWFGFGEDDVWTLFHSCAFDVSVWEMWGALLFGGRLVVVPYLVSRSPTLFLELLAEEQVTILNQTPSAFRQFSGILLESALPGDLALRFIIFAGEALDPGCLKPWFDLYDDEGPQLVNMYGITETAVHVTYRPLTKADVGGGSVIGIPIPDLRVYVLDSQMNPCPVGVCGELFVGGAGVARGYLNRPELTASRFLDCPFVPGDRLYQTGDMARYRGDGDLEFLGRADNQVKIRGFRIELGEVEAHLGLHSKVIACAVAVVEETTGISSLTGYVVTREDADLSTHELRDWLQCKLPDYMVPAKFRVISALPLTASGKLDRQALLRVKGVTLASGTNYVPARNELEQNLVEIWQEVLKREQIGIHDNFFGLGGHSLLAVRVCTTIHQQIGVEVPLRVLFDHPTIESLSRRFELVACDREESVMIPQASRSLPIPISFAQQPLWLLAQMHPELSAYKLSRLFRLRGPLSVDALRRSFSEIVLRHEVLRTTFSTTEGLPVQCIGANHEVGIPVVDLQFLPEAEREQKVLRLAREEAGLPFDLGQGPLMRVRLWQVAPEAHWLGLTIHHSVMDGSSFKILFLELAEFYTSLLHNSLPKMPVLPVQYADFSQWQRERVAGDGVQAQLAYWRKQLADTPPHLDLATDYPHPSVQNFCGRRRRRDSTPEVATQLQVFRGEEGATLFMTLLAAFQVVLHRNTGQTDLVVGTPIASRDQAELQGLLGMFLNTLPMRADLSGDPTFREFLVRTRTTVIEAFAHREVPWQVIVEGVPFPRSLGRTPFFQAAFNLLNFDEGRVELDQIQVDEFFPAEVSAIFDLELYARESSDGLKFELVGNADLFVDDSLDELLGHLVTLLGEIAVDPDRRISQYHLLAEELRPHAAAMTCDTQATDLHPCRKTPGIKQSLSSLFEQQAAYHSGQLAISTPLHRWTYRDLNEAANQVAHTLINQVGIGSHRIALLYEHDAPMVAAMLGVLKAGMAYVPLDPSNPEGRLRRILDDARPIALLSSPGQQPMAGVLSAGGVMNIVADSDHGPHVSKENLHLVVSPDAMAYLLYTSGSTGQPKAVIQNHRNVWHFIRVYSDALHLTSEDRLSLFPTYGFDAAVMDIYGALLNGASLHLRHVGESTAPEILNFLREHVVTVYHSTPTVYRHLFGSLAQGEVFPCIRLVVLGGEPVVRSDIDLYRQHFTPTGVFINGFGPTECTLATQQVISHRAPVRGGRVPVGQPVEGTEILLLDETGNECGIFGEIGIRSLHLALGYWDSEELTREKFMADPDGGTERVFRTGDFGWRRPDGSLEFLGRRDFQVKVRGHRVELGEVEAALRNLEEVEEAVVIHRGNSSAEPPLVSYVRLAENVDSIPQTLRDRLRRSLPDYMVPAAIVIVREMPLLSNGKLDRRALPAPTVTSESPEDPQTLLEWRLQAIWKELFEREAVGRHDSFFDLGGHSLLAVRLTGEIDKLLDCKLPIATLFQSPTIASLARRLTDNRWAPAWSSLVPLQPRGSRPPLFLVHGWGGDVYVFLTLAKLLAPDQPVYGIQAVGLDGRIPRHASVEEMAAHYVEEIRSHQPEGPYYLGGYSLGGRIAYEIAQQLLLSGHQVGLLALLDSIPNGTLPLAVSLRARVPVLSGRFGVHFVRWWQMPRSDRRGYFLGRWAAVLHRIRRYRSRSSVGMERPEASLRAPQIPGFSDYYQGILSGYKARRYPGSADIFVSDSTNAHSMSPWKYLVRGRLSFHRIPGGHQEILAPEHVPKLAKSLKSILERSQKENQVMGAREGKG